MTTPQDKLGMDADFPNQLVAERYAALPDKFRECLGQFSALVDEDTLDPLLSVRLVITDDALFDALLTLYWGRTGTGGYATELPEQIRQLLPGQPTRSVSLAFVQHLANLAKG
jgi:hypothetical protein